MKINVTVDLEDFYVEEDSSNINDEIKNYIANQVKNQVWKSFEENALSSFSSQVERQISLDKDLKIKETINSYFTEKKIKKQYSGNNLITCEEYIKDALDREYFNNGNNFERMVTNFISDQTKQFSKEFKDRYDLLFASQLVAKMNEVGLLREDVAKNLLK